jgi:hypothetical protein
MGDPGSGEAADNEGGDDGAGAIHDLLSVG